MQFTNVRELKMKTARILEAVDEGEEFVITYNGKPRALLVKVGEEDLELRETKRNLVILEKNHPFLKLIGKARDQARDVSSKKYKYLGSAFGKK